MVYIHVGNGLILRQCANEFHCFNITWYRIVFMSNFMLEHSIRWVVFIRPMPFGSCSCWKQYSTNVDFCSFHSCHGLSSAAKTFNKCWQNILNVFWTAGYHLSVAQIQNNMFAIGEWLFVNIHGPFHEISCIQVHCTNLSI